MINVILTPAECTHALSLIEDNLLYSHGQTRRRLQALRAKLTFRAWNTITLTQWEVNELLEFVEDEPETPTTLGLHYSLEVAAEKLEVTA